MLTSTRSLLQHPCSQVLCCRCCPALPAHQTYGPAQSNCDTLHPYAKLLELLPPRPLLPARPAGAELAGLCREAALGALREDLGGATAVAARHFVAALADARPSLTPELLAKYEGWNRREARPVGAALPAAAL